jgi:hypothetical protein
MTAYVELFGVVLLMPTLLTQTNRPLSGVGFATVVN